MKIPKSIAGLGISREEFEKALPDLAGNAFDDPSWRPNPRMPLISELSELFRGAYGGRKESKMMDKLPGEAITDTVYAGSQRSWSEAHMPKRHRVSRFAAFPLLLCLLAAVASGQQSYISRFDQFDGYTYLNSPLVSLGESGFHTQFGVRPVTWLALGFDYSVSKGDLSLTPDLLTPALQQSLGAQLQQLAAIGAIPATYKLIAPASSTTQTFAGGPELLFHHFKAVTIFVRPSVGIIHETATPKMTDPIETAIVKQLAPTGKKTDNVIFYGFGGGVDLNISKHVLLRVQADFVRDHLFSDLIANSRNTVRVSIGPAFEFGKNIAGK